jgi:hypothetical protein
LGKTKFCLGLQIKHLQTGILIHQSAYVKKVLEKLNMDKAYPLRTPMIVHAMENDTNPFRPKQEGEEVLGACDILTQGLIGLIEYSYHQRIPSFLEAHLQRIPRLSVLGLEQFRDEWPTEKFSRVCTSEDKSAQKRLELFCGASL